VVAIHPVRPAVPAQDPGARAITRLITDAGIPEEARAALSDAGVQVQIVT